MIRRAALRALPRPDSEEIERGRQGACVLLCDDAALAAALRERLAARGWNAVALARPALAGGVDELVARVGRVAALIDVAPGAAPEAPARPRPEGSPSRLFESHRALALGRETPKAACGELLGQAREQAWLFSLFRQARALSAQLNAADLSRAWFFAVTRIDGRLGLGPRAATAGVVSAGAFGLVKTLRLEWPSVFCRAVDLHPELDASLAAEYLVEELHDPDRTVGEVGRCQQGRWTIGAVDA